MFGNSTVTSQKGSRIREWEEKVFVTMIESHNHSKEFSASVSGENPVFFCFFFLFRGSTQIWGSEDIEEKNPWVMMNFYKVMNNKLLRANTTTRKSWGIHGLRIGHDLATEPQQAFPLV